MSEYAIQVKDVSKVYRLYESNRNRMVEALGLTKHPKSREHRALDHLSFNVKKGETVGIIGTNGAGKSTILKIITGVLHQTEGEVEIDGRISALLELGAGFNQEYTGIENIYLNGTMIGFSKAEIDERLDSILEFADIGDFVYQPVKSYSSGMFVRLAFAVAININPEILIVDEALSVGDVFFQAKCYKKFEEFKQAGKTILFVSHDMGSIAKYCDRLILLDKGKQLAQGEPKEIIDIYKKVLVHQYDEGEQDSANAEVIKGAPRLEKVSGPDAVWRKYFKVNQNVNEYGSGKADIVDFAVMDENDTYTSSILKGTKFKIQSTVRFNERLENPIFTYTFKNIYGVAITGTNSMFEKANIGVVEPGQTYTCTFTQEMNLQGGEYLLSISCTGYGEGEFQVFHRLYDVVNITVISDRDTVGFYDMNSSVEIQEKK